MIDLLKKIKNNEIKEGTEFKIDGCSYIYNNGYIAKNDNNKTIEKFYISQRLLNDEVEIIEEEQDIKELDLKQLENGTGNYYLLNEYGTKCFLTKHSKIIADKVNELVKAVNKLKNKED